MSEDDPTYRLDREFTDSEDPTRHTYVFKPEPPSQESDVYIAVLKTKVDGLTADKRITDAKTYTLEEIAEINENYGFPG